jgi:hypothetical protein
MSNVVNVVGRKRVRERDEILRRAVEKAEFHVSNYTNKHTIYIDTDSNREETRTTSHNTHTPGLNDLTTYDINDLTPAVAPTDEFAEDCAEGLGRTRVTEAKTFAKRYVHGRLRVLGRIRLGLLQQILRDAGGEPSYALPAAKSLGCTVERLPRFENREFVFAPHEWGEGSSPDTLKNADIADIAVTPSREDLEAEHQRGEHDEPCPCDECNPYLRGEPR